MKIKQDVEFESFTDGICDIYYEDDEGEKTDKYTGLGFGNRALGYGRVFAAKAAQEQVNAVIRVPNVPNISVHDTVEITGVGKYEIMLVQPKKDTNPPSIDLTLREIEMFRVLHEHSR